MEKSKARSSKPAVGDPGPFEELDWPAQLQAHVVCPATEEDPRPTLHGYDVLGDLARHYGLADQMLLALTGELPTQVQARAFEVALMVWAPIPISEAPVHAAVLARLSGTPTRGLLGLGATGLAEQARDVLARHGDLLRRMETGPLQDLPPELTARSDAERESVSLLRRALPEGFDAPGLDCAPSPETALLLVLAACGLRHSWQMETVLVLARLPALAAETRAHRPGDLASYPMNLPPFHYQEPNND